MSDGFLLPIIDTSLLYVDESEFEKFVVALLRLKDDVGIKQIGFFAEEEICSKWETSRGKGISEVKEILIKHVQTPLNKLLMLCSLLIQYRNIDPLNSLVSNFYGVYQIGGKRELGFRDSEKEHLSSSVIWKAVIGRVYALGALAVFREKFEAIPILVTKLWPKENPTDRQIPRYWARHAITMLRTEGRLQHPSLCLLTEQEVSENHWFLGRLKNDLDSFKNFLCQFDFVQCLIALCQNGTLEDVFPSFGIYYKYRTEPIVLDLISKGKSREHIPPLNDSQLASMIRDLDNLAARNFTGYDAWDLSGWESTRINNFLKENLLGQK